MTPAQLRTLLQDATPGPWKESYQSMDGVYQIFSNTGMPCVCPQSNYNQDSDAALIATMRNTFDLLLDLWEAAEVWADSPDHDNYAQQARLGTALAALNAKEV